MDVTTETKQGFLEDAWDNAPNDANSLRQQMRSYESSARAKTAGGMLGSVAKNNASQSYRGPGLGSYTLIQIADTWRELINLLDEVSAWVVWAIANPPTAPLPDGWPVASDDNDTFIYDIMRRKLVVIDSYQIDLIDLLLPPTGRGCGRGVFTW